MSARKILICSYYKKVYKDKVKTRKLKNNFDAASALITWLSKQHVDLTDIYIIMKATWVYHELLAYGLQTSRVRIPLTNHHKAREFAWGMDILSKNNSIDTDMFGCYRALKEPDL